MIQLQHPLHTCYLYLSLIPLLLGISGGSLYGQAPISELRIKKFPTESNEVYPYYPQSRNQSFQTLQHDPVVALDPANFLHLWRKEFTPFHRRYLTRYDLFLNEAWTTEIELERNEDVIDFYALDTLAIAITNSYSFAQKQHTISARKFGLSSGTPEDIQVVWQQSFPDSYELSMIQSPDQSYRLFYQILNRRGMGPYSQIEYMERDATISKVISRGEAIAICLVDPELHIVWEEILPLKKAKASLLGVNVDNAGNVYTSFFTKKSNEISVYQHRQGDSIRSLSAFDLVEWKELIDPNSTLLPLKVGQPGHIYFAVAERELKGKLRGTKAFMVYEFDFETDQVSDKRHAPVTSALKVQIEKTRTEFGLKPTRRFENYLLQDLFILDNGHVWLALQHYEASLAVRGFDNFNTRLEEERYEELILIEFDDTGKANQAIVIPSRQEFAFPLEYLSHPFHLSLDPNQETLRLVTWEPSGDKLRDPDRPYVRFIDLVNGVHTPRLQIFEGKRRYQFLPLAYLEWLNADLITCLIIDGDEGRANLVTINLQAEPEPESEN